ncbi:MAG: right-handed parallel beta-helix repeat-containing protein [Phycisphaeraceae bacterium]|nr:right-handed parallel beta-helix repeat-containing protein [Phycisphaerales bacterium]QOJ16167.1 MAG: right-handed parallel beta-helix repeat-containing protein [Phycisphaeraceae bacterium]
MMSILRQALTVVGTGCLTLSAWATQHLVSPGDDWSRLAPRLKPGDEIVLMPGRHIAAYFEDLHGASDKPIIIRPLSRDHPVLIGAREQGLHLVRPRHVIIRDIQVVGASGNGINMDDGGIDPDKTPDAQPWPANVRLERVSVLRTGPVGNHDGIKISGLSGVYLIECIVEGWGGSAVDLVGCKDVTIERCEFRGLLDFSQDNGVQAKGGSTDITILECIFRDAGKRAINAGGSTGLRFFRPPVPVDAAPGSRFEAERITIERCLFVGGDCAVAFVGARGVTVHACTVVNPRMWAFRILQETDDSRFGPCQRGVLTSNLVVWNQETIRQPWNIGPGVDAGSFVLESNLWWGGEGQRRLELPGRVGSDEVTDLNPLLDEKFRPQAPGARGYGRPGE